MKCFGRLCPSAVLDMSSGPSILRWDMEGMTAYKWQDPLGMTSVCDRIGVTRSAHPLTSLRVFPHSEIEGVADSVVVRSTRPSFEGPSILRWDNGLVRYARISVQDRMAI